MTVYALKHVATGELLTNKSIREWFRSGASTYDLYEPNLYSPLWFTDNLHHAESIVGMGTGLGGEHEMRIEIFHSTEGMP